MRIIHTVWRLYFVGLKFRKLLFDNISLNKFREFTVKTPHPHNGRGVLHLKTPVRAELNYHGPLLRRCVVFCDSLPHFDILRVRFQIPGPHLHRIELAALALADIAHDGTSWYLFGELSMWTWKLILRLLHFLCTLTSHIRWNLPLHNCG